MIVIDFTATRKALARYDRVKPRIDALLQGTDIRHFERYAVLMDAIITHVFDTFYADAWHLTPHEANRFGLASIREIVS